jgi:hypothetical protein
MIASGNRRPTNFHSTFRHASISQWLNVRHGNIRWPILCRDSLKKKVAGPLKGMKKEHQEKYDALQKELAAFDDIKPKALPALMTVSDFEGMRHQL